MYVNASLSKAAAAAKALLILAASILLIVFSEGSREGIAQGIRLCLEVLVPSLFPFMAVTDLFVKSGLCNRAGKLLKKPAAVLFGISGSLAPVLLLSLIGGYPAGASGIAALRKQEMISEDDAKKAAMFAVCAGPGFVVNYVGCSVYHNREIGLVILLAQILSVIITGVGMRLLTKPTSYNSAKENSAFPIPFSTALVASVQTAAKGMLQICAFVLLFSAVTGICTQLIHSQTALSAVYCTADVCTAVIQLSEQYPIELVAFAIGFGGMCVHFQIFAVLEGIHINKPLFFLIRIIQGLLTAGLTHIGLRMIVRETAVFSSAVAEHAASFGGSALSGAAVVAVCICFLITLKPYRR